MELFMGQLILRRILVAIPTIIIVSMLVFALQKLLPGDPALMIAGEERDPKVVEFIREKYRLNDPLPVQYGAWVAQIAQGDFGRSLRTDVPVTTLIAQKLPVTIQLAVMAMIVAILVGVPAGILAAVKKGTITDYLANFFALSGLSIPNFWLGILLIFLVSVQLGWLLCFASARSLAVDQDHADAGVCPGHGTCRDLDAPHALGDDRGPGRRLHPHGAGQGSL